MDRRVRKGLKARKVPWGRRVQRVRRETQEIPVVQPVRRVRKEWTVRRGHKDRKAQKVPWGRKVQPDPKVIRADPQGRKEWTVPQDPQAHRVRWEKSALWI